MRYLQTRKHYRVGDFGGELSLDSVSMNGVWLDDVTFNQKFGGEWIGLDGIIVQGTYRVRLSKSIISPNILINIYLKFSYILSRSKYLNFLKNLSLYILFQPMAIM